MAILTNEGSLVDPICAYQPVSAGQRVITSCSAFIAGDRQQLGRGCGFRSTWRYGGRLLCAMSACRDIEGAAGVGLAYMDAHDLAGEGLGVGGGLL